MKILYVANVRMPTEKAHGVQIMKTCEALAERGEEVTLLVPWRFNHIAENPFEYYGVKKIFKIRRVPSLDLTSLGAPGFMVQVFSFSIAALLFSFFSHSYDVYYSRDEVPLLLISIFSPRAFWESHTDKKTFASTLLLKNARGVVTISHGLAGYYRSRGVKDDNIIVAPDGVDVSEYPSVSTQELRKSLDLPVDKKIISYVGKYKTMGQPKGVDELVSAFSVLKNKFPNAFLLIVGINPNEQAEVRDVLHKNSVNPADVQVVTHVPRTKVPSYLVASDILVMNYPNLVHYTNFMSPLKLFEYMASGRAIVASDLPSIREILNESTAFFVKPDDTEDLVRGLTELVQDPGRASSLGEKAKEESKKYTWQKRVEKLINFF